MIGPTPRQGLWAVSGTHRDGLHTSPLIATALARALLAPGGTCAPLPGPLAAFAPCRDLITDWSLHEAVAEAAAHHAALAAEARMRPPLTGTWPGALTEAYTRLMDRAYAAMPDGYIPPPELAPLAYETGPALAELAAAHLEHCRIRPIGRMFAGRMSRGVSRNSFPALGGRRQSGDRDPARWDARRELGRPARGPVRPCRAGPWRRGRPPTRPIEEAARGAVVSVTVRTSIDPATEATSSLVDLPEPVDLHLLFALANKRCC
ncbi:hypothetical protein GCM10010145_47060 [Streptomyces ruber]|uniref:Uncharacterized protein n=2 Tax=Streptomyces TaxID=1883 RepID=A0A918BK23_9ACTN|nr:hypothetical protein GCM10010145_47060 [Streptomyces ruber]